MNANFRNFALWVIIALLLIHNPDRSAGPVNQVPYSQFLSDVDSGKVHDVVIVDQQVSGKFTNGGSFQTTAPKGDTYVKQLVDKGVQVELRQAGETFNLVGTILNWLPMLILVGIWIFLMRQLLRSAT